MLNKLKSTSPEIKTRKKLLLPSVLVTALVLLTIYGSSQVLAESAGDYPPIVQKIASRFGLKESDVNEVFEQEKADAWQKRKQFLSDRLEQAVKDGKITEDQKQKILDKKDELMANNEAERKQSKSELQQWMKDNGIDANALMPYFGFGGFGRKGFHYYHMMN